MVVTLYADLYCCYNICCWGMNALVFTSFKLFSLPKVKFAYGADHRMLWWSYPSVQCLAISVITALSVSMTEVGVFGVKQHRWVLVFTVSVTNFCTSLLMFPIYLEFRIYTFVHLLCHCYMYLPAWFNLDCSFYSVINICFFFLCGCLIICRSK
jgi:hypothetical protein